MNHPKLPQRKTTLAKKKKVALLNLRLKIATQKKSKKMQRHHQKSLRKSKQSKLVSTFFSASHSYVG